MNEFEIIQTYFEKLTLGRAEAGGLKDDAAVLDIPDGHELVITSDTLSAGTHFMEDAAPGDIAHKALRVNLSDLAAMGAHPYCYQLNIAFPGKADEMWVRAFTDALLADQKAFGIFCSGGDTTSTKGPLTLSITAMGLVAKGKAVKRSGACAGDILALTGPVGDALIGLKILRDGLAVDEPDPFIKAYTQPTPRTAVVRVLQTHAHAAIDISDGLVADVGHIADASGLRAVIDADAIPFRDVARRLMETAVISFEELVTGGDDYELALALPSEALTVLRAQGVNFHVIGCFEAGVGVRIVDQEGALMPLSKSGWKHF